MSSLAPVLVLYNLPDSRGAYPAADAGVLDEVQAVRGSLELLRVPCRVVGVRSLQEIPALLDAAPEPVVFNLVEALPASPEHANLVPALCTAAGKAHTGSSTACLSLALHKGHAKAVLSSAGVAVPPGVLIPPGEGPPPLPGPGPWILKPAQADASEGIHADSAVHASGGEGLERAVARLHERFGQAVIVERLLEGRELNVALIEERGRPRVLAIAEIEFVDFPPDLPRIVDYAAKWQPGSFAYEHTRRIVPAALEPAQVSEVERLAVRAWELLGCRGYARVDLRTDAHGTPFVIEVNPNPDIGPDAGYSAALSAAGLDHPQLVRRALLAALGPVERPGATVELRPSAPEDRESILGLLAATGFFAPHELTVAQEVLDDALAGAHEGHYRSATALVDGVPRGWACVGPTPCTQGAWDLYWLAVHPGAQGSGLGRRLLAWGLSELRGSGGRMLVAETAGRASYETTRAFYRACGFREEARLKDFYERGDDKLVFVRRLVGS
jgi:D-alanine-D-alanine ligase